MTVTQIVNLLHKSVTEKTYDLVLTEKNRNSRRKYGLTIYDIEDFLKLISEVDLYSGPEIDRDRQYLFLYEKCLMVLISMLK